jgi:hypothetical protein
MEASAKNINYANSWDTQYWNEIIKSAVFSNTGTCFNKKCQLYKNQAFDHAFP